MNKFKKIICVCLALILVFGASVSNVYALDDVETNVEISDSNTDDYITEYNFETGKTSTRKMSDFVGSKLNDTGRSNSTNSTGSYPAVPPQNGQAWPDPSNTSVVNQRYIYGVGYTWQECNPYIWGVAYLTAYWDDGSVTRGTAFVFANNALMTSAHCVYDTAKGGWCDYVTVSPSRNENSYPYGTHTAQTLYVCTEYMTSAISDNDYAVLVINTDVGLETGLFGWTTAVSVGSEATITGYPKYLDSDKTIYAGRKQYRDKGTVTMVKTHRIGTNNIDISGGNSGGPIYSNDYLAYGIMSRTSGGNNVAKRITSNMSEWLATFR